MSHARCAASFCATVRVLGSSPTGDLHLLTLKHLLCTLTHYDSCVSTLDDGMDEKPYMGLHGWQGRKANGAGVRAGIQPGRPVSGYHMVPPRRAPAIAPRLALRALSGQAAEPKARRAAVRPQASRLRLCSKPGQFPDRTKVPGSPGDRLGATDHGPVRHLRLLAGIPHFPQAASRGEERGGVRRYFGIAPRRQRVCVQLRTAP